MNLANTHGTLISRWCAAVLLLVCVCACGDSGASGPTRSLRGSGDVSFICAEHDATGNLVGRPLDSCPDYGGRRELYSLVTQEETGEVALVRMTACQDGGSCGARVLDLEDTSPGVNFMAVGAEPSSIASTPGGMASFVAVTEPGKEGIFALPTSCVGERLNRKVSESAEVQRVRDLRTWPACRLPAAPGDIEVIVSEAKGRCDRPLVSSTEAESATECPADLSAEGLAGQHKLMVALPSLGKIAVVDAQTLLDRPQGSFGECPIDRMISLDGDLSDAEKRAKPQKPDDWNGAELASVTKPDEALSYQSTPADFALDGHVLYVADRTAPVIHSLDVSDACNVVQQDRWLPKSLLDPNATVTTRKVAVSPLTPSGKKYLYAVDNSPNLAAGSVMIFDVSTSPAPRSPEERTPLVRSRSKEITSEPPDRIQFDQEVSDVTFAYQDVPAIDPETGVAVDGLSCDPDPDLSDSDPRAQYRPNNDATGASPGKLRGVFAFVALHSGLVVVVDVEDLDAPCRRPKTTNSSSEADRYGCANDELSVELEDSGQLTVSGELSCNISEPHRVRPLQYFRSDGSGPRLRSFPQLRDENGASISVDQTEKGRRQPRLLGVESATDRGGAELWVGATLYQLGDISDPLLLDPAVAERNSVVLPFAEPRAYNIPNAFNTVTFEGPVRGLSDAPFSAVDGADITVPQLPTGGTLVFNDRQYGVFEGGLDGAYCASGIEDQWLMRDRGEQRFAADPGLAGGDEVSEERLDEFAKQYGDYVDVVSELLPSDNSYWKSDTGNGCGSDLVAENSGLSGREVCDLFFGSPELPDPHREYRIIRAFNDRLIVEPRRYGGQTERDAALELLECCFPQAVEFQVRASNHWVRRISGAFEHDVRANPETLACERSENPQLEGRTGRIFEVSCQGDCEAEVSGSGLGGRVLGPPSFASEDIEADDADVGLRQPASMVCVLPNHPSGGIDPRGQYAHCLQDSATARFAIYRGLEPSRRDMQFSWRTLGGFNALAVDLLAVVGSGSSTNPRRIEFLPQVGRLVVADGGLAGLEVVGLRSTDGRPVFGGSATSAR